MMKNIFKTRRDEPEKWIEFITKRTDMRRKMQNSGKKHLDDYL